MAPREQIRLAGSPSSRPFRQRQNQMRRVSRGTEGKRGRARRRETRAAKCTCFRQAPPLVYCLRSLRLHPEQIASGISKYLGDDTPHYLDKYLSSSDARFCCGGACTSVWNERAVHLRQGSCLPPRICLAIAPKNSRAWSLSLGIRKRWMIQDAAQMPSVWCLP